MEPRAVPSDWIRAHRRCVLQEAQSVQLIPAGRIVLLVPMPMVFVRRVPVGMLEGRVTMAVGVRLTSRNQQSMLVPMVLVMSMGMFMLQRVMSVEMFVMLGDVKPDAHRHQGCGNEKLRGQRLAKREHGSRRAEEGRGREISARARRSEVAQREDEKRQARSIAQQADQPSDADG